MKKQFLLMLLLIVSATTSAQLVLNEAHYDPADNYANGDKPGDANGDGVRGTFDDEFIEFVNNSNVPLDISGYKIYDKTRYDNFIADSMDDVPRHTVPGATIIPAGGIYVVFGGGDVSSIDAIPNVTAVTATSGKLDLQNGGDIVYVTDASSTLEITFDPTDTGLDISLASNQSVVRSPAITGNFIHHTAVNGEKFSPGNIDDLSLPSNALVINEALFDVAPGLAGDANGDGIQDNYVDDEFLEFVNNSAAPLDISGYKIYDRTGYDDLKEIPATDVPEHVVSAATIIPPGGLYLVFAAGDISSFNGIPNLTTEVSSTGSLSMQNVNEVMYVMDASGTLIITLSTNSFPGYDANDNQSLSRFPVITGEYRNHEEINGKSFSPGVLDASITNNLVLNEIFSQPGNTTGDANGDGTPDYGDDEFIELVNNSGAAIDMSGYKIYDYARFVSGVPNHVVPPATVLADGGVFVLFGGNTPTGTFGGAIVQICSNPVGLALNASSNDPAETVIITDASDNVVSVYNSLNFGIALSDSRFETLTRYPEITGDYTKHTDTPTGLRYSPGFQSDGVTPLLTASAALKNTFNPVSGNWSTPGDWSKGTVPTATDNVEIPSGKTITVTTDNEEASNLNVEGTLIINANKSLKVSGNLITTGTLTINPGGSLIVEGSSTGTITYNRELTFDGPDNLKGWHTVGSPVVGQAYNDAYATANNLSTSGAKRAIGIYNTTADTWSYLLDDDSNTGTFESGTGYVMRRNSTGLVSFTGTLNTNKTVDIALETTGNRFVPIANPYAAYLNSGNFLNTNGAVSETQTIWVWNQDLGANGAYEVKTKGEDLVIAPGQGFFVKADASGGGFRFSKANQTANGGTDTFQKSTALNTKIKLSMSDGGINYFANLFYLNNATTGLDIGYEGEMFNGVATPFAVYSQLVTDNQGKNYQTQSLPDSNLENLVVPVGVNAAIGKEITFTADAQNLPNGISVYLEDNLFKTFTRLDEANTYKFTVTEALNGIGRFYLHTSSKVLKTDTENLSKIGVYTLTNATLRITGISNGKSAIKMFNILGKQVVNKSFTSQNGVQDIALPKLARGVYIVQLDTELGSLSKKIILE